MESKLRSGTLSLALLPLCLLITCKRAAPSGEADAGISTVPAEVRKQVLASTAACITQSAAAFVTSAGELSSATRAYAAAPSEATRAASQAAWVKAVDLWQRLEVLQVGPAAAPPHAGAKDFRSAIYSYPLSSRCVIDQGLVSKAYDAATFETSLVTGRGLLAAEYLLFYPGKDNGCASTSAINTDGSWSALSDTELEARRAAYAAAIGRDVLRVATALAESWDPAKGNFSREFTEAGRGSTTYKAEGDAFNALSDALFYIEKEVKDLKLGEPLGLGQCGLTPCLDALESPYAKRSLEHIRNNLLGFRLAFFGCEESLPGLDDLLLSLGGSTVVANVRAALVEAEVALAALGSPDLSVALTTEVEKVKALHAALTKLASVLKGEFVSVLHLEVPDRVQGDND